MEQIGLYVNVIKMLFILDMDTCIIPDDIELKRNEVIFPIITITYNF